MKVALPGGLIVDVSSELPFLGAEGTTPIAVKSTMGLVKCPGSVEGCCGLRQGKDGTIYCGRTGDQQAAGDIERCYKALNVIAEEASEVGAHPETVES